ncbi:MAG: hypothetical protein JKY56_07260 [Kofleriaceae bacterium]|nr:hypothetical protein [Kofleriaceae bacterium]
MATWLDGIMDSRHSRRMKSNTIIFATTALMFVACGKKEDDKDAKKTEPAAKTAPKEKAAPEAPKAVALEMVTIDIVTEDFKATMSAPKGAVFKDSYGTLEVKLGDGKEFYVSIDTDAPNMAEIKAKVEENDMHKLEKFHTESDDTLIFETKMMSKTSVWLDSSVKVGDKVVHCYSGRGANSYNLAQIELFSKACKSLAPKE